MTQVTLHGSILGCYMISQLAFVLTRTNFPESPSTLLKLKYNLPLSHLCQIVQIVEHLCTVRGPVIHTVHGASILVELLVFQFSWESAAIMTAKLWFTQTDSHGIEAMIMCIFLLRRSYK